jgi:formate hydrogenlyase subunit 6/NADH:ubiquinone oxidoreductase subunit I
VQPRQAEEQENVSRVLDGVKGSPVELTCPQHPGDDVSFAPVDAVVDIGRCLGSLSLSRLLGWVIQIDNDLWLNDSLCDDCPIGQASGWIATTADAANRFLEAWGRVERVRLVSSLPEEGRKEHRADFYDGQQPEYSRRGFFRALGRMMFRTVGTIVEETLPVPLPESDSGVPAERLRLRAVLSAMGEPEAGEMEVKGMPFASLAIDDSCSGCNLCVRICPTDALTASVEGSRYSLEFLEPDCIGCDLCAMVCPEKAIEIRSTLSPAHMVRSTPVPLVTGRLVPCKKCGAPIRERAGETPLCHICRMSYSPHRSEIDEMLEELEKLRHGAEGGGKES